MTADTPLLTAIAIPTVSVWIAALVSNSRISDVNARISDLASRTSAIEADTKKLLVSNAETNVLLTRLLDSKTTHV